MGFLPFRHSSWRLKKSCGGVFTNSIANSADPSVTFYLEEGILGSGELKPVMLTKG